MEAGQTPERLDRRDRAVGVAPGDFVEAVDEAEGPDQRWPATASAGEDARSPTSVAGRSRKRSSAPRRQRPPHLGQGQAPERDDRDRPGEPGEAVGEEDAAGQRQAGQGEAQPRRRPMPPSTGRSARRRSSEQADGEGEDEERLGGLLEGALGEVGGGEVGDATSVAASTPPPGAEVPAAPPARSAPVRTPIAKISPTKAWPSPIPGTAAIATASAVRAERVAGVGRRPEAAAQPLGPGEVQAEVVVEADPEQAPAAADRERDREDQRRRRSPPAGPRAAALPCGRRRRGRPRRRRGDRRGDDQQRPAPSGRAWSPWPGRPGEDAGHGQHRAEADRRLQPRPRRRARRGRAGRARPAARRRRSAPPRRRSRSSGSGNL